MALDVQEITGTSALVAARLCNFPTGGASPLATHIQWMDQKVRPIITGRPTAWVDVIGHASRQWRHTQGANSHQLNRALSFQRCEAVKQKVATYSPGARFNIELAEGDSDSVAPNPDDGYDRAVEILVYASAPPPKPPNPNPQPKPKADRFEIRVVGGGSASILAQADNYFFQIVDLARLKTAFYFYTGAGIGVSIPKIPGPGSVTKIGPPSKFTTTREAELYMFNSRASLFQDPGATFGSLSAGGTMRLSIDQIVDSAGLISTRPGLIPIEGGSGIQMPGLGSVSEGVLAMVSDVFPFTAY